MTNEERRAWINGATYEQLLAKWRFAPPGDPFFEGDLGDHFRKVMNLRRSELPEGEHVQVSKRIGWDG